MTSLGSPAQSSASVSLTVTPTVRRNLENAELAVRTSTAVLLQGGICTGKTSVANYLAQKYGAAERLIHLNVDDTMDSKDLLGKLSATDVPGMFDWVAGPLTVAVRDGLWVLMEDVDLASFDIFSVLLTLLQDSTLFISERNTTIRAHPNFKLLATQRLMRSGTAWMTVKATSVPHAEMWSTVILEELPSEECIEIVGKQFAGIPADILTAVTTAALKWERSQFSLRDLIKWAARVQRAMARAHQGGFISTKIKERAFMEALDCFCARMATSEERDALVQVLAEACGQPVGVAVSMAKEHKPQQSTSAGYYTIGRFKVALADAPAGSADVAESTVENDAAAAVARANGAAMGGDIVNATSIQRESRVCFAETKHAMCLLERLAGAVVSDENVLLTGETGVGKTFIVQYLADSLGKELIVHNLNQQTDCSDFIGGWKPVDVGTSVRQVYAQFVDLFSQCFNVEKNAKFLSLLEKAVMQRSWDLVLRQVLKGGQSFRAKSRKPHEAAPSETGRDSTNGHSTASSSTTAQTEAPPPPQNDEKEEEADALTGTWEQMLAKASSLLETLEKTKTAFAFSFEEGSLVKAWREGHWILLDEVNLAATEVLERVSSVIGGVDKLFITERGDAEAIPRHPGFRVFANMNPPTDVGKKDLPPSLRSKFTEFYVSEPFERNDINIVVNEYIGFLSTDPKIEEITSFFLECVATATTKLCSLDGEAKPPSFSLRTLTRALSYVRRATALYGYHVALFDGLVLGFATPLQRQFHHVVEDLIVKNVFRGKPPPKPTLPRAPLGHTVDGKQPQGHVPYEHIWLEVGDQVPVKDDRFILTQSVGGHLRNLARAVFAKRPVLLEGPTSAGKSSMVEYLAKLTGHKFVRINNHDSTEIQEYIGHYVSDEFGKLSFMDGILVDAVRHGHWVVLDELNLAPSEVLEALNRLLDDNCELFIADTQEVVKPHPQLRIFATQNPAGAYGGRKLLSRAFRNRFLEITVDDIPTAELTQILCERYALPESFAEKMVAVMTALQRRRQASQLFAGKHGFITPRDLFRWADRKPRDYQTLAEHGFLLLADRCRRPNERQIVKDIMEDITKTTLDENVIYDPEHWEFTKEFYAKIGSGILDEFKIVWTESMRRLFTTTGLCLEHHEPVLLVGETGSSKTTICQLWSALFGRHLHIVNCHQHTEASDFLGGLRPIPPGSNSRALFEWQDGPLVRCMKDGSVFVLDEVSLAEDSVLERLNSVLEPSRTVTLAEKSTADVIRAADTFLILATMNPGGDFGKKELSPALRNRFTEIYVRPVTDVEEVKHIISKRLNPSLAPYAEKMARLLSRVASGGDRTSVPVKLAQAAKASSAAGMPSSASLAAASAAAHISIRDIVAWVAFMNAADGHCDSDVAFMHGLDAVVLDGISVGAGQSEAAAHALREKCLSEACALCPSVPTVPATDDSTHSGQASPACLSSLFWDIFDGVEEPQLPPEMEHTFFFKAPSTQRNLSKLLRGMTLPKAILLEGSPGVGKTSIVEALGCALGKKVVRINLSDQTDIMDLFGTYLPRPDVDLENGNVGENGEAVPASSSPKFAWSDGALLNAVKEGHWVILDELNLAGQSVLEGLNALLDHRSTIYLPELCKEVHSAPGFRIFACQNPLVEGGGRKGLPRSFLNRFTKVRIEAFLEVDMVLIARSVCSDLDPDMVMKMVQFVIQLQRHTMEYHLFGSRGSPWEFNLRDVLRWAKIMRRYNATKNPELFVDSLFFQRMRTDEDRVATRRLFAKNFGYEAPPQKLSDFLVVSDGATSSAHNIDENSEAAQEDGEGGGNATTEVVYHGSQFIATRRSFANELGESSVGSGTSMTRSTSMQSNHVVPLMLPTRAATVVSILTCAEVNQFALLIGPSGSGKTSCLRAAAALSGAPLVTFSVTSSCDTVDLLGGFDQVEGRQGVFEWKDSVLLRAMEEGHWLVLDNANFCSASALDRLNPLVEPNGFLSINEQGLVEGKIRVVVPHPAFRLFATMDPKYGEVSRAMRNRAVEIFVPSLVVPSAETLAVTGLHAAKTLSTETLRRALAFHHAFLDVGFQADAASPSSGRLADALAAGAPNMFTLLKATGMMDIEPEESLYSNSASANVPVNGADALAALMHRYIQNRSGQWQIHKAALMDVLNELFPAALESTSAIPIKTEEASEAAIPDEKESRPIGGLVREEDVSAADYITAFKISDRKDMRMSTARLHVTRFGLPLTALRSSLTRGSSSPHGDSCAPAAFADAVIACLRYFVMDQCNDGMIVDALQSARVEFLTSPAVRLLFSQKDLSHALAMIAVEDYVAHHSPAQMRSLWCKTELLIGKHWNWFQAIVAAVDPQDEESGAWMTVPSTLSVLNPLSGVTITMTESGSLNSTCAQLVSLLAASLCTSADAHLSRVLIRYSSRFVSIVTSKDFTLGPESYLPSTTLLLSLRSQLVKYLKSHESESVRALLECIGVYMSKLQQYLSLPYSFLHPKPRLLKVHPKPLVSTAEERSSVALSSAVSSALQVKDAFCAAPASSKDARKAQQAQTAMLQLWQCAAFRREFSMTQQLALLSQNASVASLAALKSNLELFETYFCRDVHLFNELDIAMWHAIRYMSSGTTVFASLPSLLPVLRTQFAKRYALTTTDQLFPGSWTPAAAKALSMLSAIPLGALNTSGDKTAHTSHDSYEKLGRQLVSLWSSVLPVHDIFSVWSCAALQEWKIIVELICPNSEEEILTAMRGSRHNGRLSVAGQVAADKSLVETLERNAMGGPVTRSSITLLVRVLRLLSENNEAEILSGVLLLGVLKCRLLEPTSPVDPSFKWGQRKELSTEDVAYFNELHACFAQMDGITMSMESAQTTLVSELAIVETQALEKAISKAIVRPEPTGVMYAQLVRTLQQIQATLLSDSRVLPLVAPFIDVDESGIVAENTKRARVEVGDSSAGSSKVAAAANVPFDATALQNWAELVRQHMAQVTEDYGGYEDACLLFADAGLVSSMAARAVSRSVEKSRRHRKATAARGGATGPGASGSQIPARALTHDDTLRLLAFPVPPISTLPILRVERQTLRQHLEYLDSCLTLLSAEGAEMSSTDAVPVSFAASVFHSFTDFYHAVERLEEEERAAEAMRVLYKEKTHVIEGDDEKRLRKFKEMFPSYEREFAIEKPQASSLSAEGDEGEAEEDTADSEAVDTHDAQEAEGGELSAVAQKIGRQARLLLFGPTSHVMDRLLQTHVSFFQSRVAGGRLTASSPLQPGSATDATSTIPASSKDVEAFRQRFDAFVSRVRAWTDVDVPRLSLNDEHRLVGGFAARTASLNKDLTCDAIISLDRKKQEAFNVYLDPDPAELSAFNKPLQHLLAAVRALLEAYPSSYVLEKVLRIGEKIAGLPALSTPLMKVMAGSEVLLRECYEWERNASRDTSIMHHINTLSAFILKWRRTELSCWPHVLRAKRVEYERKAASQWFPLYDRVTALVQLSEKWDALNAKASLESGSNEAADDDEADECFAELRVHLSELFAFCSDFMWAACLGDFHVRLEVLKAFAFQLAAQRSFAGASDASNSQTTSMASNVLFHLVDYFHQFAPLVQEALTAAAAPIDDDIREFCRIMRWEDSTYYAVRATAEKSHLKMGRALGDLEEILRRPILPIITAEEERCVEDPAMGFTAASFIQSDSVADETSPRASRKRKNRDADKRTKANPPGKGTKAEKPVSKKSRKDRGGKKGNEAADDVAAADAVVVVEAPVDGAESDVLQMGVEFLVSSSESIVERVRQLQDGKVPQTQKTRALKTFFDAMNTAGVPYTHASKVGSWDTLFVANASLLETRTMNSKQVCPRFELQRAVGSIPAQHQVALERAADESYRFARWIEKLRDAERFPHKDLSEAQAKRGTGISESLFSHSVDVTNGIISLYALRHKLSVLLDSVKLSGSAGVVAGGPAALQVFTDSASAATQLLQNAQWLRQQNAFAFDETTNRILAELQEHSSAMLSYCTAHAIQRRGREPVPLKVLEDALGHARTVEGVCTRLAAHSAVGTLEQHDSHGVGCIAAAADELCGQLRRCIEYASGLVRSASASPPANADSEHAHVVGGGSWRTDTLAWADAVNDLLGQSEVPIATDDGELRKTGKESGDSNGDSDSEDQYERVYFHYTNRVSALVSGLAATEDTLEALLTDTKRSRNMSVSERQQVLAKLLIALEHFDSGLTRLISGLRATSLLGTVVARLFAILFKKGFCKSDAEDGEDDGDGDGEGGEGETKDGTGMDDGKGEKDVTNELENEDQLMNMKDKEDNPDEENAEKEKKNEDGEDEEEEDNAADVQTDFKGNKEDRKDSDEDEEDDDDGDEDSDKEMGDVDPEKAMERKKAKRDQNDNESLDEDEEAGLDAEQVPEDGLGSEQGEEQSGDESEAENGDNREQQIKDADANKDDDHELIGDDEKDMAEDGTSSEDGGSNDDADNKKDDKSKNDEDGEEDDEHDDKNSDEREQKDGDEQREDDDASTDDDKDADENRDGEERPLNESEEDEDASNSDDESDGADRNAQYHGQQDGVEGEEERDAKTDDDNADDDKQQAPDDKERDQQEDLGMEDEEQHGDRQEEDDSGQNWKKQDKQSSQSSRRDMQDQRMSAQTNPYRAVKEALKRHQRDIQQLRLDRNVQLKGKDNKKRDAEEQSKKEPKEDGMDDDEIDAFEFDEEGEREGMAATDEKQPPPPTEAENQLDADHNASSSEVSENDAEDAPEDEGGKRRRRQDKTDINDDEDEDEAGKKDDDDTHDKKKGKKRVKATSKQEKLSSDDEDKKDSDADELPNEDAVMLREREKMERGRQLWQEQEAAVQGLAQQLCEQLRLILAPTVADKLQGDYKTGKRINMKKIIPYIASQFKKDRIWLRRTKPNKRTYQLAIALDDSLSMKTNNAGIMSCQAVALLCKALQQLEVGEFSIVKFGKETNILHPLHEAFTPDSGPRAFSEITFDQRSTDMRLLLQTTLDYLDEERQRLRGQIRSTTHELQQIFFIISDGQITEDRVELRRLLARAEANKQMVVLVILDIKAVGDESDESASATTTTATPTAGADLKKMSTAQRLRVLKAEREQRLKRVQSNSILDMQMVEFAGNKVVKRSYMDDFPFPYYLVVRELATLPGVIADAMRQWFELMMMTHI